MRTLGRHSWPPLAKWAGGLLQIVVATGLIGSVTFAVAVIDRLSSVESEMRDVKDQMAQMVSAVRGLERRQHCPTSTAWRQVE